MEWSQGQDLHGIGLHWEPGPYDRPPGSLWNAGSALVRELRHFRDAANFRQEIITGVRLRTEKEQGFLTTAAIKGS